MSNVTVAWRAACATKRHSSAVCPRREICQETNAFYRIPQGCTGQFPSASLKAVKKLLHFATDKESVHIFEVQVSVAIRAALIAASTAAFAWGLFFQQDEPLSAAP